MSEENPEPLDLLGDPWRPLKDQRGRKSHRWTKQVAENVAVLRATGHSHDDIARREGLDPKTLRKYYSRELDHGPALAKAMVDEVMFRRAMSGVVGAARYCRESFDLGEAKRIGGRDKPAAAPKVGVKQARKETAQRVGGLYATPAAPKQQMQ